MSSKPTPSQISAAVKRVIAKAKGKSPASIKHANHLVNDLGFSAAGKLGLAALLNAEFIRIGFPPDPRLHERHSEIANTVGNLVSMYRFIFEV